VITTLREDNVRTGFLEHDQIATVCKHLRPTETDCARFMYITGWRSRSEVFLLTWAQADLGWRVLPARARHNEEPRGARLSAHAVAPRAAQASLGAYPAL
jgi:hypothetical protein